MQRIAEINAQLDRMMKEEEALFDELERLGDKTYEITDEDVERSRQGIKAIVRVTEERDHLRARAEAAEAERADLQQWVHDLQEGMFINCVYCGHRYGPDDEVPATMADALKEHIEQCPKHPMSALKAKLDAAEAAVAGLVGATKHVLSVLRGERSDAFDSEDEAVAHCESFLASALATTPAAQRQRAEAVERAVEALRAAVELYRTYGLVANPVDGAKITPGKWINDADVALAALDGAVGEGETPR